MLENIQKEIELLKHVRHGRTPSYTTQDNSCYSNSTNTVVSNKSHKGLTGFIKGMFKNNK